MKKIWKQPLKVLALGTRKQGEAIGYRLDGKALLTTSEAANVLRVHPRTVQRLVERGQLDAVHLGAAVRFDPLDVAELTERLKRPAPTAAAAGIDVLRPSRPVRISFADRLRSQHA